MTTSEVVEMIRKHQLTDRAFSFFRDEQEFMRTAAKTPRSNCVLDNTKALNADLKLSSVHEAIDRCLANWIFEESTRAQAAKAA